MKVDVIPAAWRATVRQQKLGDEEITQQHKDILKKCVNETLKDPFTI